MPSLLIADHSLEENDTVSGLFGELGYAVALSLSALDAMSRCETALPALLIVDSQLEGGLDLISTVRLMAGNKATRILYAVGDADLRRLMAAKRAGADDFLLKPYDAKALRALFDMLPVRAVSAA